MTSFRSGDFSTGAAALLVLVLMCLDEDVLWSD